MAGNDFTLFNDVIRDLYGVALTPGRWPAALDSVAALSESAGSALFVKTPQGWSSPVHSRSLETAIKVYQNEGWMARNPWLEGRMKEGFQIGEVYSDLDIATPEEVKTNPFYSDFLQSFGLGYQMVGMLHSEIGSLTSLVVHRQMERGPFQPHEKEMHLLVSRHLEQLLRLSSAFASSNSELRTACEALDAIGKPVFILDEHQRPLKLNAPAKALMEHYFDKDSDRLTPVLRHEEEGFQNVIRNAHDTSYRPGGEPTLATLTQRDGKDRLVVWGIPLMGHSADQLGFETSQKNVLVLAHPLQQNRFVDPTVIRVAFGLTTAEAKLASVLAAGQTVKAAAEELGLTEGTVRVVLKRIFAKMGVHRQSELVVRILDLRH